MVNGGGCGGCVKCGWEMVTGGRLYGWTVMDGEEAKWAWQSERRRNGGIQEWSGVW